MQVDYVLAYNNASTIIKAQHAFILIGMPTATKLCGR